MLLLILDCETTGFIQSTPPAELIEVAAALYSTTTKTVLATVQYLLHTENGNPAEFVNKISPSALEESHIISEMFTKTFADLYGLADFIVAHNAAFDVHFIRREYAHLPERQWICTLNDIEFPQTKRSRALGQIASDHGIVPADAHRALGDVTTLLSLLQLLPDLEQTIRLIIETKQLGNFYVTNDSAKARALGFPWNHDISLWGKWLMPDDPCIISGKANVQIMNLKRGY